MLAVVVVLNFVVLNSADADQKLTVPFPAQGRWTDLLGEFGGSPWKVAVTGAHADVPVGPHSGRLLHHGRSSSPAEAAAAGDDAGRSVAAPADPPSLSRRAAGVRAGAA